MADGCSKTGQGGCARLPLCEDELSFQDEQVKWGLFLPRPPRLARPARPARFYELACFWPASRGCKRVHLPSPSCPRSNLVLSCLRHTYRKYLPTYLYPLCTAAFPNDKR